MKITINGTPHEVTGPTIADVLAQTGFNGKVATALDGAFVPVALRKDTALRDGAALEILAPMQGG